VSGTFDAAVGTAVATSVATAVIDADSAVVVADTSGDSDVDAETAAASAATSLKMSKAPFIVGPPPHDAPSTTIVNAKYSQAMARHLMGTGNCRSDVRYYITREVRVLLQKIDEVLGHLLLDGDFAQNAEAWETIYGMHLRGKKVDKAAIDRALARACNVLCNMTSALIQEKIDKMTDNNIRELHWQIVNELNALLKYLGCFEKEAVERIDQLSHLWGVRDQYKDYSRKVSVNAARRQWEKYPPHCKELPGGFNRY